MRTEYPDDDARERDAHVAIESGLVDDRMALADRQLEEQLPSDVTRSRIASSLLMAMYLIAAFKLGGAELTVRLLMSFVLPWACVCFPEALGDLVGGRITKTSPRSFVWFFGWLVLLLPLIQFAIIFFAIP